MPNTEFPAAIVALDVGGHPVLITDQGETSLAPGMCAGFMAGTGNGHQLLNRTNADVLYLEVTTVPRAMRRPTLTMTCRPRWVMTGNGSSHTKMEHAIEAPGLCLVYMTNWPLVHTIIALLAIKYIANFRRERDN